MCALEKSVVVLETIRGEPCALRKACLPALRERGVFVLEAEEDHRVRD